MPGCSTLDSSNTTLANLQWAQWPALSEHKPPPPPHQAATSSHRPTIHNHSGRHSHLPQLQHQGLHRLSVSVCPHLLCLLPAKVHTVPKTRPVERHQQCPELCAKLVHRYGITSQTPQKCLTTFTRATALPRPFFHCPTC